jgi:hypothetical protein
MSKESFSIVPCDDNQRPLTLEKGDALYYDPNAHAPVLRIFRQVGGGAIPVCFSAYGGIIGTLDLGLFTRNQFMNLVGLIAGLSGLHAREFIPSGTEVGSGWRFRLE